MPVTKKKGAIFAIYADSPQPADKSRSSSSLSSASASAAGSTSASPSSKQHRARKALTSLPPSRGSGSSSSLTAKKPLSSKQSNVMVDAENSSSKPLASKPKGKMQVYDDIPTRGENAAPKPKSSTTAAPKRRPLGSTSSAPLRSAHSRTFEIYADPVSAVSATESHPSNPKTLPLSSTSRKQERASSPPVDKENAPLLDSPSSRTRSKARPPLSTKSPKKKPVSSLRFDPDAPLSDVSVAYGATGDEPERFREQHLCMSPPSPPPEKC